MSKIKKKFLDFEIYEQSEITTISGDLQTNIDGKLGISDKAADSDKLDGQSISYFLNVLSSFGGDVSGTYDAMVVANDSHTHDTRYYTKTELDAGQLDNRYYTESEVDALTWTESDITDLDKYTRVEVDTISGALQLEIETKSDTSHTHDGRYYTETELDGGQLDNRYFTESEITTWRNGTTQTEMGYVAGVTSDIQTQLDGKLSTTGKAADADKLDNHDSTYFLNTSSSFSGDVSGTYDAIVIADDSHNHIISNVDGLQTALDGKLSTTGKAADADKLDNHDSAYFLNTSTTFGGDVSGVYSNLQVADDSHNHVISNVDGLQTDLDGKLSTAGGTLSGNLVVGGNLTVNGTTTTVNSETLSIADNIITLNSDFTSGTPTQNAGMEVLRGDSPTVQLRWNESNDSWEVTPDGSNYYGLWTSGNDGPSSGLNADTVDGIEGNKFVRNDALSVVSAVTRWTAGNSAQFNSPSSLKITHDSVSGYIDNGTGDFFIRAGATPSMRVTALSAGGVNLYYNGTSRLSTNSVGVGITNLEITGSTKTAGYFYAGTTDPTNTNRLNYDGYLYATKVYNAVYNDIADFQKVIDKIEYGKCYYDTSDGAKICTERCQMAVIGIASDTFGFGIGNNVDESYAPFAVAGWVLAHVDKEYPTGTPLTNNEDGILTEILPAEKREFPERIVALYKKKEANELWGPNNEIKVNGRHWVKVK